MKNTKRLDCRVSYCNKLSRFVNGRYAGYCATHEKQIRLFGEVRSDIKRNSKELNEILVCGNIGKIQLYNKFGEVISEALIDVEDIPKVGMYKWCDDSKGHVLNTNKKIWLHHLIMGFDKNSGRISDHKNGNGFDNRKENLREVTFSENAWNSKLAKNNKSGFKGVNWCPVRKKWRVTISYNRIYKSVGYYDDFEEAKRERIKAMFQYQNGIDRTTRILIRG